MADYNVFTGRALVSFTFIFTGAWYVIDIRQWMGKFTAKSNFRQHISNQAAFTYTVYKTLSLWDDEKVLELEDTDGCM